MQRQKKAVIDIDNTLWHFCDALFERLQRINGEIPSPEHWIEWDFWENYCSKEQFFDAINDIHFTQDDDRHMPYPEARDFLATLKEHDFHITIASHRSSESIEQTRAWLEKHALLYDEIHLSYDKTILIDSTCRAVVDDAPHILENAVLKGVPAAGLLFPWNMNFRNSGYCLCRSLHDVLAYILHASR